VTPMCSRGSTTKTPRSAANPYSSSHSALGTTSRSLLSKTSSTPRWPQISLLLAVFRDATMINSRWDRGDRCVMTRTCRVTRIILYFCIAEEKEVGSTDCTLRVIACHECPMLSSCCGTWRMTRIAPGNFCICKHSSELG
jgi:hypothetical protein